MALRSSYLSLLGRQCSGELTSGRRTATATTPRDRHKHHEVPPADVRKRRAGRHAVRQRGGEERDVGDGRPVAAQVGGPDLRGVDVTRVFDRRGEPGGEEEVDGDAGVDA